MDENETKKLVTLPQESSLGNLVAGASDPVALKAYEVYAQLEPELQVISIVPPNERTQLAKDIIGNVHKRRTTGGILGLGFGGLSLAGGAFLSIYAESALTNGIASLLAISGFVLCAFGLQVILGKKPTGKEAKELAEAVLTKGKEQSEKEKKS